MKKILFNISLILGLAWMVSCSDTFDLDRPQEKQWTSTATFEGGLSNAYWQMQWSGTMRGFTEFYDFALSGFCWNIPATNQHPHVYMRQFDQVNNQTNELWTACYQAITLCNLAIALDEENAGNPFGLNTASDDYKYNYVRQVGEYYFLRGYAYYILTRFFTPPYNGNSTDTKGWIPLKTKAASSMQDAMAEKLGTIEEIYDRIISDIKKAKEILPEKFTLTGFATKGAGYECGRANRFVASALLGKIYFHMGKFAEAKTEFDYVINSNKYPLSASPSDPFVHNRPESVCSETIWEFNCGDVTITPQEQHNQYWYAALVYGARFRDSNNSYYLNTGATGANSPSFLFTGWAAYTVGFKALNRMGWLDKADKTGVLTAAAQSDLRVRGYGAGEGEATGDYTKTHLALGHYKPGIAKGSPDYLRYESRFAQLADVETNFYIDKYFRGADAPYGKFSKVPLIRTPELLLLRAWIKQNSGDKQGAADDANIVWNRSNPDNPNRFTTANVNTESIYQEFMRELMGEGFLIPFMQGIGEPIAKGDNEAVSDISFPYSIMHWPIPPNEVNLNPNYN